MSRLDKWLARLAPKHVRHEKTDVPYLELLEAQERDIDAATAWTEWRKKKNGFTWSVEHAWQERRD